MAEPKKLITNPDTVVKAEDGGELRPGRFQSSSLAGITITEPGEEEPEDEDDFDPDAPAEDDEE